jgi:hypothetical protein
VRRFSSHSLIEYRQFSRLDQVVSRITVFLTGQMKRTLIILAAGWSDDIQLTGKRGHAPFVDQPTFTGYEVC